MDPTNEQYDPDGDVTRFLGSPDHLEEFVLSPLPLSSQEALEHLPPSLPQEVLQQTPLLPQEALQQTPLFPPNEFQQTLPPLTQEALHQQTPLFPQEVHQQTLPPLTQETLHQQTLLFPQEVHQQMLPPLTQEALHQQTLLFPQEVHQQILPPLTQEALHQQTPLFPREVHQQMLPPLTQEALQQMSLLPQEGLQQMPLQLPQDAHQQMLPPLTQEVFQQMPLLPQEGLQQMPLQLPQEALQQIQGFDGTNIVSATADMETEVTVPLSVEGVIITAMESIQIDGSSSTNPSNEASYEPVFHRCLPGQRDCSGCVTLRLVSHSSPNRNLIFTVHGGIGTFDHAVFDVEYFGTDERPSTRELFYVDLSMRPHTWVRSFIVGSVTLLQTDATGTVEDSLSSFYDTLCADMNTTAMDDILSVDLGSWFGFEESSDFEVGESSYTNEDLFEDSETSFNLPEMPVPTAMIPSLTRMQNPSFESVSPAMPIDGSSSNTAIVIPDTPQDAPVEPADTTRQSSENRLKLQRQRTANMRLPELAQYLHLPIANAADKLGVCSTALKHVCRRNGLQRWPSRQIQALDRQIAKYEKDFYQASRLSGRLNIKEKIEKFQRKKAEIYEKVYQKWNNNGGTI